MGLFFFAEINSKYDLSAIRYEIITATSCKRLYNSNFRFYKKTRISIEAQTNESNHYSHNGDLSPDR